MNNRFGAGRLTVVIVAAAIASAIVASPVARAQQKYTPARTMHGHPDFQGFWQVLNTAAWDIQDHGASLGVPAGLGIVVGNELPYQPWALAKKHGNFKNRATLDPETKCNMPGVPRITYMPYPFQIVQSSSHVAIFYEYIHVQRLIYTNGTRHPDAEMKAWMGDSRGHWEGDTLVVDVTNFEDKTWLDRAGNFHSDAMHVVERYTRTGPDHMLYEATIEDPKVFTRPWKMSMPLYRRQEPNAQLLEYECYAYQTMEQGPQFRRE